MKILHIVPSYVPAYTHGGPIASVHNLNKWLASHGADVTVYTTNINSRGATNVPLNREVILDGVKVFYFPISWAGWEYSVGLHHVLKNTIKRFDIIHITSVFLSASTLGSYYAKKFKKPYIISPRGSLMKEPLLRKSKFLKEIYISLLEKRNLTGADAIHFTSEMEKGEYLAAGLPLKKAIVIPNSLDPDKIQLYEAKPRKVGFKERFKISQEKKIILFLSRLNWKKGLDTLIPAFAGVIREELGVVLVIAGGDEEHYRPQIEAIIAEQRGKLRGTTRKLDENIIFTGMLLGKDKIAAFQAADLFVLPSYSENFGMAVIEAMYFGLPVVITDGVAIAPYVQKENAGLVVKKNVGEVKMAILRLLKDPAASRQIGKNGKKLVQKYFSPDAAGYEWLKQYEKLIS